MSIIDWVRLGLTFCGFSSLLALFWVTVRSCQTALAGTREDLSKHRAAADQAPGTDPPAGTNVIGDGEFSWSSLPKLVLNQGKEINLRLTASVSESMFYVESKDIPLRGMGMSMETAFRGFTRGIHTYWRRFVTERPPAMSEKDRALRDALRDTFHEV